jgi:hypothetical protein
MRLENVSAVQQGKWQGGTKDKVDFPWSVPNTFNEKVSFLSYAELRALKDKPERINWVEYNRQRLVYALADSQAVEGFKRDIAAGNALVFTDGKGRPVTVRAGAIAGSARRWELLPVEGGVVTVDEIRGTATDEGPATITAARGVLINDAVAGPARMEFRLELERARVREAGSPATAQAERATVTVPGLRPSPNPAEEACARRRRARCWRGRRSGCAAPDPEVAAAPEVVDAGEAAPVPEPAARPVARRRAVVVLTGRLPALLLSRRLPLTVYLWTFFPAVASTVTISGGSRRRRQGRGAVSDVERGGGAGAVFAGGIQGSGEALVREEEKRRTGEQENRRRGESARRSLWERWVDDGYSAATLGWIVGGLAAACGGRDGCKAGVFGVVVPVHAGGG